MNNYTEGTLGLIIVGLLVFIIFLISALTNAESTCQKFGEQWHSYQGECMNTEGKVLKKN